MWPQASTTDLQRLIWSNVMAQESRVFDGRKVITQSAWPVADRGNQGCFSFLSGEDTGCFFFFTRKCNLIKLENKTVAPGKASVVEYFHSISSLFKDHAEREYLFQCGSDLSSSCLQKVGFGNVFSMRSSFADLGPVSPGSIQQEPPGVC